MSGMVRPRPGYPTMGPPPPPRVYRRCHGSSLRPLLRRLGSRGRSWGVTLGVRGLYDVAPYLRPRARQPRGPDSWIGTGCGRHRASSSHVARGQAGPRRVAGSG